MLKSEEDIIKIIENDTEMMKILEAASRMKLPDWWICAGFVRAKIWDSLHGFEYKTSVPDIDVIYFDNKNLEKTVEKKLETELRRILPAVPWSVKNEARMHLINDIPPYYSAEDAISKFPETATALGVKLDKNNHVILTAPHGVIDLLNLEVKPTPYFKETIERAAVYEERITNKNWKAVWPRIKIYHA
ncbi:nucleotidyltransferase family protein [Alkalicoccus saliphilus]|uniref:Nucleotidyltransferase family protein n=1 Tax=Alkalicoccus saliphilus TaxID=200989 RepID=A0A2T4U5J6_9BACI|nr:nucleotidyltransferase family protein [Alkalicoccus saliphilus]PTL38660.1 hypothetical protein C6Y45_09910 [Alkalicoccus saliphilus]